MGKIIVLAAVVAGIVALIGFALKLIGGLVTGALNLVLGVAVVIALILIVIFMFAYAAKH